MKKALVLALGGVLLSFSAYAEKVLSWEQVAHCEGGKCTVPGDSNVNKEKSVGCADANKEPEYPLNGKNKRGAMSHSARRKDCDDTAKGKK